MNVPTLGHSPFGPTQPHNHQAHIIDQLPTPPRPNQLHQPVPDLIRRRSRVLGQIERGRPFHLEQVARTLTC